MGSFSFLFPAMLGALGAASVPIIIHILHRLRSRTVEFPTNRFLRQATVPSHRRPDPLNWLILFLRVCFVALLAMGLAGMVYDHSAGDDSSKGISRAILLDNSFSMTARSGKRPRFDAAREVASSLADSMRPRDRACAFAVNRTTHQITAGFMHRADSGWSALNFFETVQQETHPDEALRTAFRQLAEDEAKDNSKEIWLITDLSGRRWHELFARPEFPDVPEGIKLFLVDIAEQEISNIYVDDVKLSGIQGESGRYELIVHVAGDYSQDNQTRLELFLEGRKGGEQSIGPDGRVAFQLPELTGDYLNGFLKIADGCLDPGGRFFFCIRRPEVKTDSVFLWQAALESDPPPGTFLASALDVVTKLQSRELRNSSKSAGGLFREQFDAGEMIILSAVPAVEQMSGKLRGWLEEGHVIVAFAGPCETKLFESTFLDASAAAPLIKAKLRGTVSAKKDTYFFIDQFESSHPVFEGLTSSGRDALRAVRVNGYWKLDGLDPDPNTRVLARLNTGSPFILETEIGAGKLILFLTSADRKWTDFPLRPAFAGMVRNLVEYGMSGQPAETARRPGLLFEPEVKIPAGLLPQEIISSNAMVELQEISAVEPSPISQKQLKGNETFLTPEHAGLYRMIFRNESESRELLFAVNVARSEMDLSKHTDRAPSVVWSAETRIIEADELNPFLGVNSRTATLLWPWLAALAVTASLSELVLSNLRRGRSS